MKKILLLLLIPFLFSCGEKPNSEFASGENFEFNYDLDTVKVQIGELLLAVDGGLSRMALSPDKNSLYFYNSTNKRLDEIDLNSYELVRSIPFTEEGPKGIGSLSPAEFHITNKGNIIIPAFDAIRIMNSDGDLITRLNWDEYDFVSSRFDKKFLASFTGDYHPDGDLFFGTYGSMRGGNSFGEGLAIIDWEAESMILKEVPLLLAMKENEIVLEGAMRSSSNDQFYIQQIENQVLVSTNGVNGIAIYFYETDSLIEKTFSTESLPERRAGDYPRKVNSMEEFEAATKAKYSEHQFGPFVFDEKSKRYYRISYFRSVSPVDGEKWNFILSIFDQNLEHIQDIADFPNFSGMVFFKDGMLHKGINQDDELYFVRLKPRLSH